MSNVNITINGDIIINGGNPAPSELESVIRELAEAVIEDENTGSEKSSDDGLTIAVIAPDEIKTLAPFEECTESFDEMENGYEFYVEGESFNLVFERKGLMYVYDEYYLVIPAFALFHDEQNKPIPADRDNLKALDDYILHDLTVRLLQVEQGCTQIIATTAVGSLRDRIGRGDLVIPDQFIDFTRRRAVTFFDAFEPHKANHVSMTEPFSGELRGLLIKSARELKLPFHEKGTVITIEGPRFSTKAESHMFRAWGADIINMSTAPECILANEADIPYAAIAMSTDHDCWKDDEEQVTWEAVLKIFNDNVEKVLALILKTIPKIPG